MFPYDNKVGIYHLRKVSSVNSSTFLLWYLARISTFK